MSAVDERSKARTCCGVHLTREEQSLARSNTPSRQLERQYQIACMVLNEEDEVDLYTPQSLPFWKNSRKLKLDSVVVSEGGLFMGGSTHTQKNFKLNEEEEIQSVYYTGGIKSKHLKKVIREENLILSLKADGTISFQ